MQSARVTNFRPVRVERGHEVVELVGAGEALGVQVSFDLHPAGGVEGLEPASISA